MSKKFEIAERVAIELAKKAGLVPADAEDVCMALSTTGATWTGRDGSPYFNTWQEDVARLTFPAIIRRVIPREWENWWEDCLAKSDWETYGEKPCCRPGPIGKRFQGVEVWS
jgi:hypothetical protein